MRTKQTLIISLLLVIGVVILINILSSRYFFRLDLTSDKQYTLSEATRNLLKNLDQPVTVKAYFTNDLPQEMDLAKTANDFRELLIEFENISKGQVVYEFISPNGDETLEREIQGMGVQQHTVDVREKDKAVQKNIYLGAVVYHGEQSEVIGVIPPGSSIEYMLFRSIMRMAKQNKPIIGLLQGHSEATLYTMPQAIDELSVLYSVENVFLDEKTNNLDNYDILAIIAPADTIPVAHLQQLEQFLEKGKKLFIAYNRVDGNINMQMGNTIYTGLEDWLKTKGISIDNNFVIDVNCGIVGIPRQMGPITMTSRVDFYFLPIISTFTSHPITSGIEAIGLKFASTCSYHGDSSILFTPLAKTSKMSGTRPSPTYFDFDYQWTENDFPLSNLTVAAAIEGPIAGNPQAKIVLVGDGDFLINGQGQEATALNQDNINFMVNAIDYLAGDVSLITLRTKGITTRPLDQIEAGKKTYIKWLNFSLPLIIIILFGLFRSQQRKLIRLKRMEEGHV